MTRAVPLLQLLAYYTLLVGAALVLIELIPATRSAVIAPITQGASAFGDLMSGQAAAARTTPQPWNGSLGRLALTCIAAVGALLLALPVAWIHMFTRRLRYDPSLVQSIIILPIVVAGVVLVVKNSLALAFALAGIVAGVRFRQKLNEPQEAVYVLLALGIGLAAGVQALDVALAMSAIFNLVVLGVWRYDLGAVYAPGAGPALATGSTSLVVGRSDDDRERIRDRADRYTAGMDLDGILIIHATDPDPARHGLELSLAGVAEEWRLLRPLPGANGFVRIDVLVRLREDQDPVKLLSQLEERWSAHIAAAEYIPYRLRQHREEDDDAET